MAIENRKGQDRWLDPCSYGHRYGPQLLDFLGWVDFSRFTQRLTYYVEATGLAAFGVAWLTASRIFPVITNEDERIRINPFGR